MGAKNSIIGNQKAFVEKTLRDIEFSISDEEVQFVQNGIETLVGNITDYVYDKSKDLIEELKQELVDNVVRRSGVLEEFNTKERLIKAGSFYDSTKNYIPDEFDFVFIIGSFHTTDRCALQYFLPSPLRSFYYDRLQLLELFSSVSLARKYIFTTEDSSRSITFVRKIEETGPALKVEFLYTDQDRYQAFINVDIVPAFDINDSFLAEDNLKGICSIPKFNQYINETGSYVIVNRGIASFTKTENKFIREHLSPYHKNVYRLVKHLINGNDKNESFKSYCRYRGIRNLDISSFTIKTTMIAHHFNCAYDKYEHKRQYINVCAGDIILDLRRNIIYRQRRHILSAIQSINNENNTLINKDKKDKKEITEEEPKHSHFRSLGSEYLLVLGKSLNPDQYGWDYAFKNVDMSYSQYMLGKGEKLFDKD